MTQVDRARYFAWKTICEEFISRITSQPKDDFKTAKVLPLLIIKRFTTRLSLGSIEIMLPFHIADQHVFAHKYVKNLESP
jgi:hypothetical protein